MFTTCHHTKFHMSSSNGTLVATNKIKVKYRFCATNMCHYIHTYHTPTKRMGENKLSFIFLITSFHTIFQDSILSGTRVAPTLQVHTANMLILLMVRN